MKVLFISNADLPDFQSDMVFYGGRTILGHDFIDVNKVWYMYSEDKNKYWNNRVPNNGKSYGRGFTLYGQFGVIDMDREDILDKIENRYFDKIIYGSVHRCLDYIDTVKKIYPPKDIIFIDGEDHQYIKWNLIGIGTYLKRELIYTPTEFLKPINFAIPSKFIVNDIPTKVLEYAKIIPGDLRTYIYDNESDYFKGYMDAWFGVTFRKGGWDCLRHYEILMNGCIPFFPDLDKCPPYTMWNFPKKTIMECNSKLQNITIEELKSYTVELLEYTRNNLTTEKLFNYILNE
jgi:hypothetical protein